MINRQTGNIVGTEASLEGAQDFADEQAQDSQQNTFIVYKPVAVVGVKKPVIGRVTDIFKR